MTRTNGTVDLRTGKLREHRREDLITRLASVEFDPDAQRSLWDDFLRRVLPDPNLRSFVQRAAGYSLTGLTSEEVLFFPYGPTATGKSSFLAALGATLGDYAAVADFETFLDRNGAGGPRNDIARLVGRRLVASQEVNDGQRLAEGLVKQLTSGDVISARFLYSESFEFLPEFKLWLSANHRPRVRADDDAIWRRILQIPFTVQIPIAERDPGIKAALRNPNLVGPAILAWAVRGCLDWRKRGLDIPGVVKTATEEYRTEMDSLGDFLADCCVLAGYAKAKAGTIYKAYLDWCKANEENPISQRALGLQLTQRGLTSFKGTGGSRWWSGIALTDERSRKASGASGA